MTRLVLVSGKGGVGKTSVSCAVSLRHARAGRRVLLVSTDPAHNLGHAWDTDLGDDPRRVASPGGPAGFVDAVEIDPALTVDRHLAAVGQTLRRLLPEHMHGPATQHLDLARDAPGTHESAVLERLAELVVESSADHDVVVVDTAPTGHTLRLVALPERLTTWTEGLLANRDRSERFGAAVRGLGGGEDTHDRDAELRRVLVRRRERFASFRDLLLDPSRAGFWLVTAAERLPVAETLALRAELDRLGIAVERLVVNRRSPDDGGLLTQRRALEATHVQALARLGVPLTEVPLLPGELVGAAALATLADLLPD